MALSKLPRPICWTKWIKNNPQELPTTLEKCVHKFFKQRDQSKFRWTFLHAVCSSRLPIHVCKAIFSSLRKECLLSQLGAKDSDGDTPLSSMIRTGDVDSERIALLLQQIPSYTKHMLQSRNKKGKTPIERAFDMQEWAAVGILLKECIQHKILPELTGIGTEVPNVKTLLHKAFERKDVNYLQIYLATCRECNVKPGLLVPTKKGCTPWWYLLMNHKDLTLMQRALDTLVEFGVDIDTLYIDTASRASLLHEAYRRNNEVLVKCLDEAGANPEIKDALGLKPSDRKRAVDIEVVLTEYLPVHSTKSSRKRAKRREMRRKQQENQNEENVADVNNHQEAVPEQHNIVEVHVPHLLEPAEAAMQLPPPAVHAPAPECAANAVARAPLPIIINGTSVPSSPDLHQHIVEGDHSPQFSTCDNNSFLEHPDHYFRSIVGLPPPAVHAPAPECAANAVARAPLPIIINGTSVPSSPDLHQHIVEGDHSPQFSTCDNNSFLEHPDHYFRSIVGVCGADTSIT